LIALIAVGMVARAAGHRNVGLLGILVVIGVIVIAMLRGGYRTHLGDSYFSSMHGRLQSLHDRATTIKPGSGSRELLWLTALFGAAALPTETFPSVPTLWSTPNRGYLVSGYGGDGGACDGGGSGDGCGRRRGRRLLRS